MGKTGLKIGILLVILGIITAGVCLLLPVLTSNHVRFSEAAFGLIPAGILFLPGLTFVILSFVSATSAKKGAAIYQSQLQSEGIILLDENVQGTITYRNFHRPGAYNGLRKVSMTSLIALTEKRLLALNGSKPIIDVTSTDERLKQMKFSLEGEDKLCIAFDANLFQPEWSGEIEYRFKTARAKEFFQKLNEIK